MPIAGPQVEQEILCARAGAGEALGSRVVSGCAFPALCVPEAAASPPWVLAAAP